MVDEVHLLRLRVTWREWVSAFAIEPAIPVVNGTMTRFRIAEESRLPSPCDGLTSRGQDVAVNLYLATVLDLGNARK